MICKKSQYFFKSQGYNICKLPNAVSGTFLCSVNGDDSDIAADDDLIQSPSYYE